MNVIEIHNISKSYGKIKALENISLEVHEGELFGLIGSDGAGKSTLFEILATLLLPSNGTAEVMGLNCTKDIRKLRNIIGYMPGKFSLYQDLSVEENLKFFAEIYGTTIEDSYEYIKDIWQQIEPFKTRLAGKLSGGMKQKLALCCTLVHHPKVMFLDEPTTGVDPVSRREFWAILKRIKQFGVTIFVSTPYMDEATMCDRVALIQNGKIMDIDTPQSITAKFPKKIFVVETSTVKKLKDELQKHKNVESCYAFGKTLHVTLNDENQSLSIDNANISIQEANIEDCFIRLMQNGNNN